MRLVARRRDKGPVIGTYVCDVCGHMVERTTGAHAPICEHDHEEIKKERVIIGPTLEVNGKKLGRLFLSCDDELDHLRKIYSAAELIEMWHAALPKFDEKAQELFERIENTIWYGTGDRG